MKQIILYNTLTKSKQPFVPIKKSMASIYTCGPTVYAYPQIGNWVAYIRWDTLVRLLIKNGYNVTRVMNITDVGHLVSDADEGEDKLEKGAKREGKTAWEVADYYTKDFIDGMHKLNLIEPTYITRATDFIEQQKVLIQLLEAKGYTYKISDGIYFNTSKFKQYADFARLDLDALKAGARVENNIEKVNPYDFALWKFTPKGQKRDMEWESPWGKGFPGWHLECSAMALEKLGATIDIHTGGIDHIPVHHTNEIAQSQCATDKKLANYWLHNNFLLVDGARAAKSLGNAYTLQDLEARGYSALDFKMFVLQSHYRTASNFTWENLDSAKNRLQHWRQTADVIWQPDASCSTNGINADDLTNDFITHLNNDLDTPATLAKIDSFMRSLQRALSKEEIKNVEKVFKTLEDLFGLQLIRNDITNDQKEIINKRRIAREDNNWQESDELRMKLEQEGINIADLGYAQRWYRN